MAEPEMRNLRVEKSYSEFVQSILNHHQSSDITVHYGNRPMKGRALVLI